MTPIKITYQGTNLIENYCKKLRENIKKNYIPISNNTLGTVEFQIVVDRSGDILLMKQITSSGCEVLNNYAKLIIQKSFPFEQFPDNILDSYLDIILPIKFVKE